MPDEKKKKVFHDLKEITENMSYFKVKSPKEKNEISKKRHNTFLK